MRSTHMGLCTENTNQYIRVLHGKHKPEINIVINIMVSVRNIVIVKTLLNELVIKMTRTTNNMN